MTMLPRVSIITPSYNQASFLEETIQSVLTQDYPNIEYIVIDGGSTDGSVDIIERYADRLAFWVSEPDRGQPDALRKGFARASGEILAWLNSDDFYLPHAVYSAVSAFTAAPAVGVVSGGCRVIAESGELVQDIAAQQVTVSDLLWANDVRQPSTFFRRTAYDRVGGIDDSFHYSMDYDLWLRLLTVTSIQTLPDVLATFRLHPSSKTVSQQQHFFWDDLRAVENYFGRSAGAQVRPAVRRRALMRRLLLCLETVAADSKEALTLGASLSGYSPRPSAWETIHALAGTYPRGWGGQTRPVGGAQRLAKRTLQPFLLMKQVLRVRYSSLDSLHQSGMLGRTDVLLAQWALRVLIIVLPLPIVQRLLIARTRTLRQLLAWIAEFRHRRRRIGPNRCSSDDRGS